jgi:hypothetical protein
MISTLLLFADSATDPMVAGVAVIAVLCGALLLGGRSVIRVPYQILRSFVLREPRHESMACSSDQSTDSPRHAG